MQSDSDKFALNLNKQIVFETLPWYWVMNLFLVKFLILYRKLKSD